MISFRAIVPVLEQQTGYGTACGGKRGFLGNTRSLSRPVWYRIVYLAVEAKYCGTVVVREILPRKGPPRFISSPDRMSVD